MSTPTAGPYAERGAPDRNEYDALAELFLGGGWADRASQPSQAEPSAAMKARSSDIASVAPWRESASPTTAGRGVPEHTAAPTAIEALLVGHLPVRASIWVSQFVSRAAQNEARPVALARLAGEHLSVRLFGKSVDADAPPLADASDALLAAVRSASRLFVQTDEVDEPLVVQSPLMTRAVLLLGANQAAVVDAYRTLKNLAGSRRAGEEPMRIAAAVMGAPESQARAALERLDRAASVFLGSRVEPLAGAERVEPARVRTLFEGDGSYTASGLVESLHAALSAAVDDSFSPVSHEARADRTLASAAAAAEAEPRPEGRPRSLALLVEGISPIAMEAPDYAGVQFGVDGAGAIQLLAWGDDEQAAMRLIAAQHWAQRHAALLAVGAPAGSRVDTSAAPVAHLLCPRVRGVRTLLDANLRVHAVVRTDGEHWHAAEVR